MNRDWNSIINDGSKPQSELVDKAIIAITSDYKVWHEFQGDQGGGFTEFNCAHCGAGLLLSSCSCCGNQFRDDQYRTGWYTPLSQKMIEFLKKSGHEFAIDPTIARQKEINMFSSR